MNASEKGNCETANCPSFSSQKSDKPRNMFGVSDNAPGKCSRAASVSKTVTTNARKLVRNLTGIVEELRSKLKRCEKERNEWKVGYTELYTDAIHLNKKQEDKINSLKTEKEEAVRNTMELKEKYACSQQTVLELQARIKGLETSLSNQKSDGMVTGDQGVPPKIKPVVEVLPFSDKKFKFACPKCPQRFSTTDQLNWHKKRCLEKLLKRVPSRNVTAVTGDDEEQPVFLERMLL